MASLAELAARNNEQQENEAERARSFTNYWPQEGDRLFFAFLWTGEEGDEWFEFYGAHEIPPTGNQQYSSKRFCPVLTRWSETPCRYCGHDFKSKEMMRMGLYVFDLLRRNPPKEGAPAQAIVTYKGEQFYRDPVNAYREWDTSAWSESPFKDILWHAEVGNIQSNVFELQVTGAMLKRRYKIYPLTGMYAHPAAEIAKIKADGQQSTIRVGLMASTVSVETVAVGGADLPAVAGTPPSPATTLTAPATPPVQIAGDPFADASVPASAPTPVDFNPGAAPTQLAPTQMVEPQEFKPEAMGIETAQEHLPAEAATVSQPVAEAAPPAEPPPPQAPQPVEPPSADQFAEMEKAAEAAPPADAKELAEPDPSKLF